MSITAMLNCSAHTDADSSAISLFPTGWYFLNSKYSLSNQLMVIYTQLHYLTWL